MDELHGFGFALSCDFLKECGYTNYPKPDVHVIEILRGPGFVRTDSQIEAFDAVTQMARQSGTSPVIVDKVLWILGSGKFNENQFQIPSQKNAGEHR